MCIRDRQRRTGMMKFRSFIGVACAAIAIATAMSSAAAQEGETVTKHFEQAIPNIPGKSLVAFVVDYAPGGASPSHTHAKSAFIFAYVVSGAVESQVNDGPKRFAARARAVHARSSGDRDETDRPRCRSSPRIG